jgi:hypothetical protein
MSISINEIQTQIITTAQAADALPATSVLTENEQSTLTNITSTSKVSVFRLMIYVVSVCIWTVYKLMEIFRADIDERVALSRPYSKGDFISMALAYQHGQTLPETGIYDNTGLSTLQLLERKIIAKSALVEGTRNGHGILRIKAARSVGNELVKLSASQLTGFDAYMRLMGPAGITLSVTSEDADDLKVEYVIYFDPLVLNNLGNRLDGTDETPIIKALQSYLLEKNFRDFNGNLSMDQLNDVIEVVPGVTDVFLENAYSRYATYGYEDQSGSLNIGIVDKFVQPQSGYFKLDIGNSIFTYLPR